MIKESGIIGLHGRLPDAGLCGRISEAGLYFKLCGADVACVAASLNLRYTQSKPPVYTV